MVADVFMIGGANGAGKTTAALTLLPQFMGVYEFVNADEIARGLNPLKPETADLMAGRMMIERMGKLIEAGKNFAFETTCAGHHHLKTFQACKAAGYRLNILFLWLPSPEAAIHRVAQRVMQGGHGVPSNTIERRYINGLKNLFGMYLPMAEKALILNSVSEETDHTYSTIAEKTADRITVTDHAAWRQMELTAKGR